jgi:hypothetical protein
MTTMTAVVVVRASVVVHSVVVDSVVHIWHHGMLVMFFHGRHNDWLDKILLLWHLS